MKVWTSYFPRGAIGADGERRFENGTSLAHLASISANFHGACVKEEMLLAPQRIVLRGVQREALCATRLLRMQRVANRAGLDLARASDGRRTASFRADAANDISFAVSNEGYLL